MAHQPATSLSGAVENRAFQLAAETFSSLATEALTSADQAGEAARAAAIILWEPFTSDKLPLIPPVTIQEAAETLLLTGIIVALLTTAS